MISANDLILFYLGLELQSLSLYILASLNRDNLKSNESGLKYFILSSLDQHIHLATIEGMADRVITINSLSKY